MLKLISELIFSLGILSICGCLPRGETVTLDEVLQTAQRRFAAADKKSVPTDVAPNIEKIGAKLNEIVNAGENFNFSSQGDEIADIISQITPRAGYTSRPSMGEVASQYRLFEPSKNNSETKSKAKLLVARTYTLLALELETTKFSL